MDTFVEQIVKQKTEPKQVLTVIGTAAGVLLLNALALLFFPLLLIITLVGGGLLVWWVAASQSREAEYAIAGGEIRIDRIIAKSRRKCLVRVSGNKIESLLPVTDESRARQYDRVVMAASEPAAATWYFTYHSQKNGHTAVFFEPQERVLGALRRSLPRLVQMDTDRALR